MSADDVAPPAARRTLADLPTELKAQIVGMARTQDEAHWNKTESSRSKVRHVVVNGAKDWTGRSLNALFLVNREWSSLAAAELFEHIDSDGCDSFIFKWSIARRYADKIKHASFDEGGDDADIEAFLKDLRQFGNLTELTFDSRACHHLFESEQAVDAELDMEHLVRRQELRALGTRITRLNLEGSINAYDVLWLLACFPSLEVLEVQLAPNSRDIEDAQDLTMCRKTIASLPKLERLVLDADAVEALIPQAGPHVDWGFSSSLRSLKADFKSNWLDAVSAFAALSASTLVSLDIALFTPNDHAEEVTSATDTPFPFPHLRHLRVEGDLPNVEKCVRHFETSPVISLDLYVESRDPSSVAKLVKSA